MKKAACETARAMNLAMRVAAHEQARRAIEGTAGGADTRHRGTRETIRAGERMTVVRGADPLEDMHDSLSARQWNAGLYLRDLWRDCLPGCELPSSYGNGAGHGGQRHLTHDEHLAAGRAWQDYRAAMDHLNQRAGPAHVRAVQAAVRDYEAAPAGLVREGLEELGRLWRMR